VLYGSSYWNKSSILKLSSATARSTGDLKLFQFADDPRTALGLLQAGIAAELEETTPALAHSRPPK